LEVTILNSAQEPRILAATSGDKNLINIFEEGRDLYATIGSMIFHTDYWNCMENSEDGIPNPEGKKRRKKCKTIVLGVSYGMG
jgi:DNA polymerase I-like protein with 3'-5' exonuclease and polymerase domains